MSLYIKLGTQILTDPKLACANPEVFTLWCRGLLYAKEHLTDGFVPMAALPLLTFGFRGGKKGLQAAISELTGGEDPLWQEVAGGYTVGAERWANWQTTREEVEAKREADRERKAEWRKNKKNKKANEAVTDVSQSDTHDCHNFVASTEPEHKAQSHSTEHKAKAQSQSQSTEPSQAFDHDMVATAVITETNTGGMKLRLLIAEITLNAIAAGKKGEDVRDLILTQWRLFQSEKANLEWQWGSLEKFLQSGLWHDPKLWPWKQGCGPPDEKRGPVLAVDKLTRG